jgi:hypothetical protein
VTLDLAGHSIDCAPHNSSGVHIKNNETTIFEQLGPPTLNCG